MIDDTTKSECSQSDDSGAVKLTTCEVNSGGESKAPESAQAPIAIGGKVDLFNDARHLRRDRQLVETAIREKWPISSDDRRLIVERLVNIVTTTDSEKSCVAAARALIAADGLNVAADRPAPVNQRLTINIPAPAEMRSKMADVARFIRGAGTIPAPE